MHVTNADVIIPIDGIRNKLFIRAWYVTCVSKKRKKETIFCKDEIWRRFYFYDLLKDFTEMSIINFTLHVIWNNEANKHQGLHHSGMRSRRTIITGRISLWNNGIIPQRWNRWASRIDFGTSSTAKLCCEKNAVCTNRRLEMLLNGFVKKWFMQLRANVNYTTYLYVSRRRL